MGFERTRDGDMPNAEHGFENADIDLESDELSQLKTVRAPRRTNKSTVEVKTGMRRDRMGRRGYNDEDDSAEGADLIAPDRPIRIAGSGGRRGGGQRTQPFMSENSEFGELFENDGSDAQTSDSSRFSRLDGLAYDERQDGDDARFEHIFNDQSAAPVVRHGENMVQELMREREQEDARQRVELHGVSGSARFGLENDSDEVAQKPQFSRRERKKRIENEEKAAESSMERGAAMEKENQLANIQPESPSENQEDYQEQEQLGQYGEIYPAQPYGYPMQPYGYPMQPYGYPAQPYGYPPQPYGYPAQPYGYMPQPYGYPPQPMPYGYPAQPYGYMPQPMPYGYPQQEQTRRQRRPAPRPMEEQPAQEPVTVREEKPERPVSFPAEEKKEPEQIAAAPVPVPETKPDDEDTAPRFNRRGSRPMEEQPAPQEDIIPEENENAVPSGFNRRSRRPAAEQSAPQEEAAPETAPSSGFTRRGRSAAQPQPEETPEEPTFVARRRNAPMDAEALSRPSSNPFADADDDNETDLSSFRRRRRTGAPD